MRTRTEHFQIRSLRRTYDRKEGKFKFFIEYETSTKPTPRSIVVSEAFGLGLDESRKFPVLDTELKIGPRDIVYITGDSGSGKSVLLRALKEDLGDEAAYIDDVKVKKGMPLIETVGKTVEEGLDLLSKVGLGDAFLFLRSYEELSDGQKYRYRLAKILESNKQWWLADEFCATLDRDTAKIVSYNVSKMARFMGKAVIVATTHGDLVTDLAATVRIHKRFGKEIAVQYLPNKPAGECSLAKEMAIEKATMKEWHELAGFHYRSHHVPAPRSIFCLKRAWESELCGVIVYSYPPPSSFGRRLVMPKMTMSEMNQKLSSISRVVVHPKYRTIGLGAKLIRETLPLAGTEFVEMSAVMSKYNPFAEKAGMKKVVEQGASEQAAKILRVLEELGFDRQLLGSEEYVREKVKALNSKDLLKVKNAFATCHHPRFLKSFSWHQPYGISSAYKELVYSANLEKVASLVKICGFLLQTKVYLFWRSEKNGHKNVVE